MSFRQRNVPPRREPMQNADILKNHPKPTNNHENSSPALISPFSHNPQIIPQNEPSSYSDYRHHQSTSNQDASIDTINYPMQTIPQPTDSSIHQRYGNDYNTPSDVNHPTHRFQNPNTTFSNMQSIQQSTTPPVPYSKANMNISNNAMNFASPHLVHDSNAKGHDNPAAYGIHNQPKHYSNKTFPPSNTLNTPAISAPFDNPTPSIPSNLQFFPNSYNYNMPNAATATTGSANLSYFEKPLPGTNYPASNSLEYTDQFPSPSQQSDVDQDPPLLEELGINIDQVFERLKSVILFRHANQDIIQHCDLCGPLLIVMVLAATLLMRGKSSFGTVYSITITGSIGTYGLVNLVSQHNTISLYATLGILGYGLLPIAFSALLSLPLGIRTIWTLIIHCIGALWSTVIATMFIETGLSLSNQRVVTAYPILLLYSFFAILVIY